MASIPSRYIMTTAAMFAALGVILLYFFAQPSVPDFRQYAAGTERKKVFFDYFLPLVQERNQAILTTRQQLKSWRGESENLSPRETARLKDLADAYGMESFDPASESDWETLLRRVDTVPPSLALAQAANESAWGTSRFARMGNNFFGQWCFETGCGIVPEDRGQGAKHEVAIFASPRAAVASYIRNLNSHPAYRTLRYLRAELRAADEPVTGKVLAAGLGRYSGRGEEYVAELLSMIDFNHLSQYDLGPLPQENPPDLADRK